MSSKHTICVLLIVFLIHCLPAMGMAEEGAHWPTYQGAWFAIKYPPGFRVKPSLKSRDAMTGYDSVFFISPDEKVEFYVFAPHWRGEPEDIKINPHREVKVSEKFDRKGNKTIHAVTVKEKQGKYYRSWIDIQDNLSNTRLVFGIKYQDQPAYEKYRPQYLIFRKSLRQFSD